MKYLKFTGKILLSLLALVSIAAAVAVPVFVIWAFVSWINWLVKDTAFEWFTVWAALGSWVYAGIAYSVMKSYNRKKEAQSFLRRLRSSKFQKKLDEAMKRSEEAKSRLN